MQKPSGGGKNGLHRKFDRSYDDIISYENLLAAWQEFLNGKKKRKDVAEFSARFADNMSRLHNDLVARTYCHGNYHPFKINDPKPRDIHKATVRDRLVHHAIYRTLYPYFDGKFVYDSYSCRRGKGTHRAIDRFRDFGRIVSKNNTRTCWILKCDIRKFFASIDHAALKSILARHILDRGVIGLFSEIIDSFHTHGKPGIGLPLGNLTSQLLVNIYMNKFDHYAKRVLKAKYYIRYADDFVVLSEDKGFLKSLIPCMAEFFRLRLNLEFHPKKVFIKTLSSGVDFLGWVNFPKHRVLRTATKWRMLRNLEKEIDSINHPAIMASYLGLLKHGNAHTLVQKVRSYAKSGAFSISPE